MATAVRETATAAVPDHPARSARLKVAALKGTEIPNKTSDPFLRRSSIHLTIEAESRHVRGLTPDMAKAKSFVICGPASVFIAEDLVYASFNDGDETAQLQVVIGPSIGAEGYGLVDMSGEEPWASLR